MELSAVWTIVELSDCEATQMADNLVLGFPDQISPTEDCNAAIKTPNRGHAEFYFHQAYHSIVGRAAFLCTPLTDDCTDWL